MSEYRAPHKGQLNIWAVPWGEEQGPTSTGHFLFSIVLPPSPFFHVLFIFISICGPLHGHCLLLGRRLGLLASSREKRANSSRSFSRLWAGSAGQQGTAPSQVCNSTCSVRRLWEHTVALQSRSPKCCHTLFCLRETRNMQVSSSVVPWQEWQEGLKQTAGLK